MLFYSPHANFQVICSKTRVRYHPVTGDEIDRTPGVWANFGKLGPQYEYANPETGEMMTGASITGHYYDTDLEAAQNGWDDDTKEMVERKLQALCLQQPDRIRLEHREIVRASSPWPTYDSLDADQVVALAQQLGLVEAALAYERENRDRADVIDGLSGTLDAEPVEEPVAVAAGKQPEKAGSTITV